MSDTEPLGVTDGRCNWCGQPTTAERDRAELIEALHWLIDVAVWLDAAVTQEHAIGGECAEHEEITTIRALLSRIEKDKP